MWPNQSSFENSPFVDKGITMKLRRYGNTLCKKIYINKIRFLPFGSLDII